MNTETVKFEYFLTLIGEHLHIRLGRAEPKFDGSVVKTLVQDGISVGMTRGLLPVFVRVRSAQLLDKRIAALCERVAAAGAFNLSEEDKTLLFAFATQRMRRVYDRYRAKRKRELAAVNKKVSDDYNRKAEQKFSDIVERFKKDLGEQKVRFTNSIDAVA